jgi:Domain of unknown function (DUF1707)
MDRLNATALRFFYSGVGGEAAIMVQPDDEMAADMAGGGHLRVSQADREYVIDALKVAFVQGRLTKDELDERVGQALGSWTYAELAAVTADIPDIPVRPIAGESPSEPSREGEQVNEGVGAGVRTALALWVLAALLLAPIAILAGQARDTALNVSSPDGQACQAFNAWLEWANYPAANAAWLLDTAVADAEQGSSVSLLANLETLQQATGQSGQSGVITLQLIGGSAQSSAQSAVQNAAISAVGADCSVYPY